MELESPVMILKELLRLAQEDLEMARKNSERLAEKARKMGEKAMTLQEEAADAEKAANDAKAEVDDILQRESEGMLEPYERLYCSAVFFKPDISVNFLFICIEDCCR